MLHFTKIAPLNWLLNSVFVLASIVVIASWFTTAPVDVVDVEQPTIIHDGTGKIRSHYYTGENYFLNMKAHYSAKCTLQVSNKIIQFDPEKDNVRLLVHHYSLDMSEIGPGEFESNNIFHIPEWLPSGDYQHVRESFYQCGYIHHTEKWSPANISIIAQKTKPVFSVLEMPIIY